MKYIFGFCVLLLFFSCEKPPQNVKELLLANLEATGGKGNWEKLNAVKTQSQNTTLINNNEVAKVRAVKSIKLSYLQKEEIFTNNLLTIVTLNKPEGGYYFKFENDKPVGYTKIEPTPIGVKWELEFLKDIKNLKFEEVIWNDKEVFKLKNMQTKDEYIYDKDNYFLIAHISETPYGTSTNTYDDYREIEGYFFAFEQIKNVPSASYIVSTSFLDIEIDPLFHPATFEVNKDWIVLKEGSTVPVFQAPLFGDNSRLIRNDDFEGKIVLLDFWATWCKPCIAEFPNLKNQYEKYKEYGFEVLSVSLDEKEGALKQYLEKNNLPWTNTWVQEGFKSNLARDFQLASIPKSILIDRTGKILAMDTEATGEKLNHKLAALFDTSQ